MIEEVARTFARLQVEATAHVGLLLGATGRLPGIDRATWLSEDEMAALAAAVPRLRAACAELAGLAVPPSLVHGDLHLANVAKGPRGYLFFDWTDACVAHPFLDLPTMRRGSAFAEDDDEDEAELRERLRAAYLPEWASFGPPARLARAWELAAPHLAQSTAWWLRRVLAGLAPGGA